MEAVLGNAISRRRPAAVLRSHYTRLRALLAITVIAVVGFTTGIAILATNEDRDTGAGSAAQLSAPAPAGSTRYDGGPEEGTRGAQSSPAPANAAPGTRYDGGPEEGSRGSGH